MKVKDEIFYQVATDRDYKVGDKLVFGKDYNVQGQRVFNTRFYTEGKAFHDLGFEYADSKKILKNKDLVIKISKALSESDFVIRELAVEEVRKEKFPNLPSRLKCMYLTDKKENVLSGVKEFHKKGFGTQFQAVAVKLNGNVFFAKSVYMPRLGLSYQRYRELAEKYWSQDQNSDDKIQEVLFEGTAEIVEILDEVKLKRNYEKNVLRTMSC